MALSNKVFASGSVEAGISNTKLRQEQMKSELGFTTLAGDVFALSKQIEDIIGDANWKADVSGQSVQIVDLAAHLDGDKGASKIVVKKALEVTDGADLKSTLAVAGKADFAGIVDVAMTLSASQIKIDGDAVGNLYLVGASGEIADSADLTYDGATFTVATNFQVNDSAVISAELDVEGTGSFAYANVLDLTPTRVVFAGSRAGVDGALIDSEHMTYAAGVLTVSGSTYSKSAEIAGNLTVQGNFIVEGDTVTQNVSTVTTQDSVITLNRDAAAIPAAGAGIEFENGGAIVGHMKTNGSGDLLLQAATGGELTLDVSAAFEITVDGNLAIEAASAINQDVTTDAMPQFTKAKLTDLTATRLMASNADKETVSVAALSSWVAGTANQISIADDDDGSITLSLPQSIHPDADVEFDSLKLGDNAADAGKAYMIGASGSIVAAAYDQFVMVAPDLGLTTSQEGFKIKITQSQDLRSSASPEFAALNLAGYGDLVASGSDFKISATSALFFSDAYQAGSTFSTGLKLAESSTEWTKLESAYGSEKSLLSMLADAAPANNMRLVLVKTMGSAGPDMIVMGTDLASLPIGAANYQGGKADVYVNGQKQVEGATADFEFAAAGGVGEKVKVSFKYNLQIGDVVELIRYPSAAK